MSDRWERTSAHAAAESAGAREAGEDLYRHGGCFSVRMRCVSHGSLARAAIGALACLAAACADTTDADAAMNRDLDSVFDEVARVERELAAHAATVAGTTEPGAIDTAEVAHRDALGQPMNDLDQVLLEMTMYCPVQGSQERGRTHDMQASMSVMRNELERHRVALAPRPAPMTARAEEETHLRDSRAILLRLREAAAAMRHEAIGFYRCEHGNH